MAYYDAVLTQDGYPHRGAVLNNYANIYIKSKDYEQAYPKAKAAYDTLPIDPNILDTYGWVLVNKGQVNEGLNFLRQSFVMDTASTEVRFHIAYALSALDRRQEALREVGALLVSFDDFALRREAEALKATLESQAL